MINLLKIEFFKLIKTKFFWISNIMYLVFLIIIPRYISYFLRHNNLNNSKEGLILQSAANTIFFEEIYKILIIIYALAALFMIFTIISSITKEYKYRTVRQNIIDGLSKLDFFLSKFFLILLSAIFYTIITGVIIYLTAYQFGKSDIGKKEVFLLLRYLLFLLNFFSFAFFISFLFKKFSLSLSFIFTYMFIIEPLLSFFVASKFIFSGYLDIRENIVLYFPLNNIYRILPFSKELNNYVLISSSLYFLFYMFITFYMFKKRDL